MFNATRAQRTADLQATAVPFRGREQLVHRHAQDILIAGVDGLTGFPEAIMAASRETTVQTVERMHSTAHMIRPLSELFQLLGPQGRGR